MNERVRKNLCTALIGLLMLLFACCAAAETEPLTLSIVLDKESVSAGEPITAPMRCREEREI